jgi:hypothetical protein
MSATRHKLNLPTHGSARAAWAPQHWLMADRGYGLDFL